jgi:hypothetical protein
MIETNTDHDNEIDYAVCDPLNAKTQAAAVVSMATRRSVGLNTDKGCRFTTPPISGQIIWSESPLGKGVIDYDRLKGLLSHERYQGLMDAIMDLQFNIQIINEVIAEAGEKAVTI